MHNARRISFLIIPLFSFLLIGGGCLNRAAQNVSENANPSGSGKIDISDDTYNYADKETGASASVGANARIPDDFPSDVPRYGNAQILAASVIPNQGATLLYTTDDSPATVSQWYEDELIGDQWTLQSDSNYNGRLMQVFEKDDVMISIAVSQVDDTTSVTVIRAIK